MTTRSQKGDKKNPVVVIDDDGDDLEEETIKKVTPSPKSQKQTKYSPLSLRSRKTRQPPLRIGDLRAKCASQEEEINQLKKGKRLSVSVMTYKIKK